MGTRGALRAQLKVFPFLYAIPFVFLLLICNGGAPGMVGSKPTTGDNKGGFGAVTELPPRGSAILETASEVRPRHLDNI